MFTSALRSVAYPISGGSSYAITYIWKWVCKPSLTDSLIVFVGTGQLFLIGRQSRISDRQRELMEGQLKATQIAADAALASLDHPWVFLTDITSTWESWIVGDDGLAASFTLNNYGRAPAFISGIQCAIFVSPGPGNKIADIGQGTDLLGVFDFPAEKEVQEFRFRHCREPRIFQTNTFSGPISDGVINSLDVYRVPFVVPGGGRSGVYNIGGRSPIKDLDGKIPLERVMNTYLLGTILHDLPGGQVEIIDFCYVCVDGSSFQLLNKAAPYNVRRKEKWGVTTRQRHEM
jgi:hypothetical protein